MRRLHEGRVDAVYHLAAVYDLSADEEAQVQVNYFGCLRVTMGVLPGMVAKRRGHVVNVSSRRADERAALLGLVASKAALDAWTRYASSEYADTGRMRGIHF